MWWTCQVESLSSAVRQLELERNEVQSQLHESQALSQALRDKLENVQHDLASQGPHRLGTRRITAVEYLYDAHSQLCRPSLIRELSAFGFWQLAGVQTDLKHCTVV